MKRLLEGQQLQRTIPPTAGRVEPVVHLPGGLTLDDRSCWQYPTMLVGNVGSGKSTLMEQIRRPVLAHADRVQDTVVIFAAKPDVLRCRRPGFRPHQQHPGLQRRAERVSHPHNGLCTGRGQHRNQRQLAGTGRAVPHLLFCRPGSYRGRRSPGAGCTQRGTHHAQPPVHWQLQHSRRPVLGPAGHPSGRQAGVYPL